MHVSFSVAIAVANEILCMRMHIVRSLNFYVINARVTAVGDGQVV